MSSLMQFGGKTGNKGVELQFYHVKEHGFKTPHFTGEYNENGPIYEGEDYHAFPESSGNPTDEIFCPVCQKMHPRLWVAWRKPVGMMGVWVVFRYNGEEHVPDMSIPIATYRIPRDAKMLDEKENGEYWHQ